VESIVLGYAADDDDILERSRGNCRIKFADSRVYNSDYIQIRSPVYLPHSAGRYAAKRFRKAQCPIVERLTNSIMMNGRNNGKKLMAVRIVAHTFEIVRIS
jgi:predicted DsbA family dithiol-disulfide isomerase